MACRYCGFAISPDSSLAMSLETARSAVNAYLKLLCEAGQSLADIHFFGGEPFFAPEVVHFIVPYARSRAAELGLTVRFEATTNGSYGKSRCQWIADHFDTIVLSLDGTADIQDYLRPSPGGAGTYDIVAQSARIFSEGDVKLVLRACVTEDTAGRLPEIAGLIVQNFRPDTVCFETLTPSPKSLSAGLAAPDPYLFARNFHAAAGILEAAGIEAVHATAVVSTNRVTFCPVGQDALIVSPDGSVDGCYLLAEEWQQQGLDMHLGRLDPAEETLLIDSQALQRLRRLSDVRHKSLCQNCFCQFLCAGGCHVHHDTTGRPGSYDALCRQTRITTIVALLKRLEQGDITEAWLADQSALAVSAEHRNDRL
jgi:uncharacterized protein